MTHALHTRNNAMRQHSSALRLGALALTLVAPFALAPAALAADASKPHVHKGELKPYPDTFKPVPLSAAEKAQVAAGKPVFKKMEGDEGGRGVAVFQVNAPPAVVWDVLQQFERYPTWIDNVDETEVYRKKGEDVDVRFEISSMGVSVEYFISHKVRDKDRYMTWTLDYSRESDLGDSVGAWKVDAVEGDANKSVVTYSVDLKTRGWVPGFIRTLLVDKGLQNATSWVAKVSEARAKKAAAADAKK